MNDIQAAFGQPGVGLLAMLIIGALAGWIAGKVTESRHGILTNILVGIAGAFVGDTIAELVRIPIYGFWRTLGFGRRRRHHHSVPVAACPQPAGLSRRRTLRAQDLASTRPAT